MSPAIRTLEVLPEGILVLLEDGSRRRMAYGVLEASDIASVHVAPGRESIRILLRRGGELSWDVSQMTEV